MPDPEKPIGDPPLRRGAPPVNPVLVQKGLSSSRGMFRIVILHKSVVWQGLVYERNKRRLEDVTIKLCIHDAIEDTYFRRTVPADSCPDVNFKRVLGSRLSFRWLINLSITCSPVLFQGDRAFITEDDIVERISTLQNLLGTLKPFHLIGITNQGRTKFFEAAIVLSRSKLRP